MVPISRIGKLGRRNRGSSRRPVRRMMIVPWRGTGRLLGKERVRSTRYRMRHLRAVMNPSLLIITPTATIARPFMMLEVVVMVVRLLMMILIVSVRVLLLLLLWMISLKFLLKRIVRVWFQSVPSTLSSFQLFGVLHRLSTRPPWLVRLRTGAMVLLWIPTFFRSSFFGSGRISNRLQSRGSDT